MAGFTETALVKKLAELNNSQQSIQTLSLWLIHHRKHCETIVKVWFKELVKAKDIKKLTFMYLANDVIQNSKKKGPEFSKQFSLVLRKAFEILSESNEEKTKRSLERILHIWEERGVYDSKNIKEFRKGLVKPSDDAPKEMSPPKKKIRVVEVAKREKIQVVKPENTVEVEVDGKREVHVTLSPRMPAFDPPEPEELIKAIMDLENSASSDAAVREKIANLPPEVSEINQLTKLTDRASGQNLAVQVNEAVQLLTDYNSRLASEMEDRKKLSNMLHDFLQAQRDLLAQAEQRFEAHLFVPTNGSSSFASP